MINKHFLDLIEMGCEISFSTWDEISNRFIVTVVNPKTTKKRGYALTREMIKDDSYLEAFFKDVIKNISPNHRNILNNVE